MKPKQARLLLLLLLVGGLALTVALTLRALSEQVSFFRTPTQLLQQPTDAAVRLGGLVKEQSVQRLPNSPTIEFTVTDLKQELRVRYTGIVPDLFREGQGVVAEGTLDASGIFMATTLLARHDENYMPPDVAKALGLPVNSKGAPP